MGNWKKLKDRCLFSLLWLIEKGELFCPIIFCKVELQKTQPFKAHWLFFTHMNVSLLAKINEWITISIKRRKDGDDERPAIHIYIGGSKTCHDATHCVIWPIKIQTIHQPFLVFCYNVHGCKAHSNRKVRWDGVIGVVFQSWSPEKSDFTMTHLKCYFYKERKNQSLWVTFYFVLHLKGII